MKQQLSIQGERAQAKAETVWATEGEVAEYVSTCSPGVAICRGRGSHNYGPQVMPPRFNHIRDDGNLEAESDCTDCGCVTQVQVWEAFVRKVGRKNVPGVRPLFSYPDYHENELGESYLSKVGRIPPRAFRAARASASLDEESLDWVNAAIRQQRKHQKENP